MRFGSSLPALLVEEAGVLVVLVVAGVPDKPAIIPRTAETGNAVSSPMASSPLNGKAGRNFSRESVVSTPTWCRWKIFSERGRFEKLLSTELMEDFSVNTGEVSVCHQHTR